MCWTRGKALALHPLSHILCLDWKWIVPNLATPKRSECNVMPTTESFEIEFEQLHEPRRMCRIHRKPRFEMGQNTRNESVLESMWIRHIPLLSRTLCMWAVKQLTDCKRDITLWSNADSHTIRRNCLSPQITKSSQLSASAVCQMAFPFTLV